MKKLTTLIGSIALGAAALSAQTPGTLTVTLPSGTDSLYIAAVSIDDYTSGAFQKKNDIIQKVGLNGRTTYTMPLNQEEDQALIVTLPGKSTEILFAAPDEAVTLDFTGSVPLMGGSPLLEKITEWEVASDSLYARYNSLTSNAERQALISGVNTRVANMFRANTDDAFGVWLLNILPKEALPEAFDRLGPGAAGSILAPMYNAFGEYVAFLKEQNAREGRIAVGQPAPDFTLPDADGRQVSLSDFKGSWVMLDFWGTWCGWCIKGIPQMKEQWAELKDRNVVFLSVACNDPKSTWISALKKYDMPWVNVWSDPSTPSAQAIQTIYAIKGFPTKLVINPEGKIALIVVGENPDFYNQLRALL